uniref:Calponin-homology (CH) domain-containing protein n=1 Tax=Meloidogyne javanica TaxID=6303 RepID=A0A915NDR4_MELJA
MPSEYYDDNTINSRNSQSIRTLTIESRDDPKVKEIHYLLIYWLNEELAQDRIVVRNLQEDIFDGQVIQKLVEKLAQIKDIVAILHLLISMALHFRAPIRFPTNVNVQVLIYTRNGKQINKNIITEQLTTKQTELAPKGERDAFDTLFDHGPDKLQHVKSWGFFLIYWSIYGTGLSGIEIFV